MSRLPYPKHPRTRLSALRHATDVYVLVSDGEYEYDAPITKRAAQSLLKEGKFTLLVEGWHELERIVVVVPYSHHWAVKDEQLSFGPSRSKQRILF